MVRLSGIVNVGVVHLRRGRDKLRNVIGVLVRGSGKGFAARNEGSVKPERQPREYQCDVSEFAPP